ncbi:Antirestriction protein [Paraburkholderia steynii]|uniref:Antirestriction protein n=1 Tax=Paraburkholderia steynii TaxID=1245441 RepID=A0A7Z7FNN6_9BURK|nr:antirestriction protein [Paraburkholderia steynii]SDJ22989.1 Antirestriction protein [Paraburkholderia steynii]
MQPDSEILTSNTTLTAMRVPETKRVYILPRHFGRQLLMGEAMVYQSLQSVCEAYSGGFWDFFELSNGGFYMAPRMEEPLRIQCEGNGFDGEMSCDAAGIVACMMAFNALAWQTREARFGGLFYQLSAFVAQHAEAASIFAAID